MRSGVAAAVALSVPLLLAALAGPPANASLAARGSVPFSQARPADVIILVDESGSMATFPGELKGERQAAAEIANAAWSANSQVAIYGFGSAPPGEPESAAVDKICGLTPVATRQDIAILDGCAGRIEVRPPDAFNTDFNAALSAAGQVLTAQGAASRGRVPLVFMLTDGTLDLGNTRATANARQQLPVTLRGLAQQGIEIWPVGFGAADVGALAAIAAGGAQTIQSCPQGTGGAPRVTSVPPTVTGQKETEEIQVQVLSAFAAASCATAEPSQWQVLGPGKHATMHVTVNPLTTLGSIVVNKGNPAVTVTYSDPDGGHVSDAAATPAEGYLNGAAYELSSAGPGATQEALRLDYPVTGQWAVTFYNPTGQAQIVGTQVLWQGQVYPDVSFAPVTGDSGKQVRIIVEPAPDARLTNPADLAGLHVTVTVQWRAGGAKVAVPVTFDRANGQFTGKVMVPSGQSGNALVTATVQAAGVAGAGTATLAYQPGGGLGITVSIPPGIRIDPGGSRTFSADFTNLDNTRQPITKIQFLLSRLAGTGNASITQPPVTIGSGTGTVLVTIHVGQTRGPVQGVIEWEVAGTTVQHPAGFLDITVEPPPPWYTKWWVWTAAGVVLLVIAGLIRRRQVRIREDKRKAAAQKQAEKENMNVRAAGLALLRRDVPGDSQQFVRWTGRPDQYVDERWFEVRRRSGEIPRLIETTHNETTRRLSGSLLLTRTAETGTFRLTAPGIPAPAPVPADGAGDGKGTASDVTAANGSGPDGTAEPDGGHGTAPDAESPPIQMDRPFDPPPGTNLDDCVFVVTLGDAPWCRLPDPEKAKQYEDEDNVAIVTTEHIRRDYEFERPEPTVYDNFGEYDEHSDAGGSGT